MKQEYHEIWLEQCEAAQGIRESHGLEKALGYLIGEKLMNFVEAAESHPDFARELPGFVAEIRRTFESHEIREYLQNVRRVGALGHIMSDEGFEDFRAAGAVQEDPVQGAEDVLILERIKEMLLE